MTCVDTFSDIAQGVLHITTYRVIFAGNHAQVLTSTRLNIQNVWIQKISLPPTEGLLVCTTLPSGNFNFAPYYSSKNVASATPPPSSWNFHWPSVGGGGGALWIPELHNNSVNIIMIWQKLTVSSLGFCSITLIMGNMSLLMQILKKLQHEVITIRLAPDMPPLVTQDFTVLGVVIKQKLTRIKGMCRKEQGSLTYGFSNILRVIREI